MEEWKEYKLGDISTMKYGKLPSSTKGGKYPLWSGYRYVGVSDIMNCPKDTLVVVARGVGGTGDVKVAKEDCFLTNLSISVNLNKTICNPYYLYYKYLIKNLKYLDSGSAQSQITIDALKNVSVILPPLSYQNKVISILKSLDDKIENNRKINENLEQQAQALFKSWFVDFEPFRDQPFVESELGMIPEGWRVGTIISISKQVTDGVHNSVKDEPKSNYLLLSAKNIKNGELNISSNERRIDKDVFNQLRRRTKLSKGDILITSVGTIGEMLLLKEDPTNYEFQRSVAIIKPNDEIVTSEYVYLSLKSRLNDVKHMAHGAVQQCIFIGDMKDFKILIAPYFDILAFSSIVKPFYDQIKLNQAESHCLSHLRDTLLPKLMSGEIKL